MDNEIKEINDYIRHFLPEMIELRHYFHQRPELAFQEIATSSKVAELLSSWGFSVTRDIGKTGLVGCLTVGEGSKRLGIRADMDALPLTEETRLPYASTNRGVMHACGHDGHITTLLTAARYVSETKRFNGTLNLIFQPAEEGSAGAKAMIDDGLFERFPCDAIFGLHNWPGISQGTLRFSKGPVMASVDTVYVTVRGRGGHGAAPETTIDPIVTASSMVMALQSITARNVSPSDMAIISVGLIQGGTASNIIPSEVKLEITVRCFSDAVRTQLEQRIKAIVANQAASFGATADVTYELGYPVTVNDKSATEFAQNVAEKFVGPANVIVDAPPLTVSEDFSYMLQQCPGCYVILGNGSSSGLHTPNYDFADENLLVGGGFWACLAQTFLK